MKVSQSSSTSAYIEEVLMKVSQSSSTSAYIEVLMKASQSSSISMYTEEVLMKASQSSSISVYTEEVRFFLLLFSSNFNFSERSPVGSLFTTKGQKMSGLIVMHLILTLD